MFKKTARYIFLGAVIAVALAGVSVLHAQGLANDINAQVDAAAGQKGASLGAPIDPRLMAVLIIRTLLTLVGTVLLGLNIYAGFLWMTAGGNEEQVTKAKGILYNATIGLVIVLSAYSITIFAANLARGYFWNYNRPYTSLFF